MNLAAILLGLLNIAIVVAVLMLIGALAMWLLSAIGWGPPLNVQKGYIAVVAIVALYMIVALLLGGPTFRIISSAPDAPGNPLAASTAFDLQWLLSRAG